MAGKKSRLHRAATKVQTHRNSFTVGLTHTSGVYGGFPEAVCAHFTCVGRFKALGKKNKKHKKQTTATTKTHTQKSKTKDSKHKNTYTHKLSF